MEVCPRALPRAQKANPRLSLANVEGLHGNALVSLCRVHLDRAGMLKAWQTVFTSSRHFVSVLGSRNVAVAHVGAIP